MTNAWQLLIHTWLGVNLQFASIGSYLFVGWPMIAALRRALDFAARPDHRTTPESPWFFFRMSFLMSLRRTGLYSSIGLLVFIAFGAESYWENNVSENGYAGYLGDYLNRLFMVPVMIGFSLFQLGVGLVLGPRLRTQLILAFAVGALQLLVLYLICIVFEASREWSPILGFGIDERIGAVEIWPYAIMLLCGIILTACFRYVRKQGVFWFRFEG